MSIEPLLVGWREWATLPELDVPLIKVKLDTGAKTSSLHAYDIKIIKNGGKEYAEFIIHPLQRDDIICQTARALIIDRRNVKSSNGHVEERIVIRSPIKIGSLICDIDITLTNRDIMNYRMLIGREAMSNLLLNPTKSYIQGKSSKKQRAIAYAQKLPQAQDAGSSKIDLLG
jgi:ribosomal protein S6--L-glutamate ligase